MQPTRAIWRKQADLLAADTTSLAAITAMNVHLFTNDVTPSLDMLLADLTEATFTGSTAIGAGTGTQPSNYDASDGLLTIWIKEPAGGFLWTCTVTPVAAQTVFGFYLTDNANAVLYAAQRLLQPVTISMAGQVIDIGDLTFKYRTDAPF